MTSRREQWIEEQVEDYCGGDYRYTDAGFRQLLRDAMAQGGANTAADAHPLEGVDYLHLLKRYMQHVSKKEGTYFIPDYPFDKPFTKEECQELERLSKEDV
jgi:hypothetical protein